MRPSNGGKGDDRRPGKGYEKGHDLAFGARPAKPRWVPPPLPDLTGDDKKPTQEA